MDHIQAATVNELYAAAIDKRRGDERKSRWVVALGLEPMRDGDQWLFLWGENLQEGVSGFGDTPEAAAEAFDFAMTQRSGTNVGANTSARPCATEDSPMGASMKSAAKLNPK